MQHFRYYILLAMAVLLPCIASAQTSLRSTIDLNSGWKSVANDLNPYKYNGFERTDFSDADWQSVDVPHNWDRYEGFRRTKHGNRHGFAWYRRTFETTVDAGKRYFLFFEGVGSYATVYVNGLKVGEHAGGRTTFTLDVTNALNTNGQPNLLAVRADHPAEIRDLPWVCGGCSTESGFSEGSQPLGIFRPVQLVVTNDVRIEPFGIHVWNDTTVTEASATLNFTTEIKNYGSKDKSVRIITRIMDAENKEIAVIETKSAAKTGSQPIIIPQSTTLTNVHLWSPDAPYLYTIISQVWAGKTLIDQTETPYGIRWIQWPIGRKEHSGQFFINGKPFFINGTAEYEHLMGTSHAFTDEQIKARVMQIKAAGYNAFRDAHQPHNLRYQAYWDKMGLLWWPQMAAHIWFDTPSFRDNFKLLLRQMMKERRNSPSIILWGLENESTLPTDFAKECVDVMREMDPTVINQRLVTTCNGGTGTDWNVVQNWSGTYSGDPNNYTDEITKQLLNGEYGAWRSIDWHSEGPFIQSGPLTEDRMTLLMELKISQAEKARNNSCGQFHWLFNSHENPGRTQNGEGLRDIDRLGPFNYKGLFTPWGEPTDAYYMYRANFAPKATEPMVYIASHTWPNRYVGPGVKSGIIVYSNCDEVELFNDVEGQSLGKQTNGGIGTHLTWDSVAINYNVLRAVGYINGKAVANDLIVLQNLPPSPNFKNIEPKTTPTAITDRAIYRVNCGGPDYTDAKGNLWMADVQLTNEKSWGSLSWTDDFDRLPAFYGSQRRTFDPIAGTGDAALYQTFRYGTDRLRYRFPLPDGRYTVQLHFTEPWYGTGGGLDCNGWRIFDVAVNDSVCIRDLDIWKEVGHDKALTKQFDVQITQGMLELSFPKTKVGQAIISAIAIFTNDDKAEAAPPSPGTLAIVNKNNADLSVQKWLDWGDRLHPDADARVVTLPSALFAAEWVKLPVNNNVTPMFSVALSCETDVYVALLNGSATPAWLNGFINLQNEVTTSHNGGTTYSVYLKRMAKGASFDVPSGKCVNSAAPWLVMAQPVYNLGQAADQRPVKTYPSEKAVLTGSGKTDVYRNRTFVQLGPNSYSTITWKIATGVADIANFHIRFFHPQSHNIRGRLVMKTHDGIIMMDQSVEFTPLKADGTWRGLRTQTPGLVNAGNYTLTLTLMDDDTVLNIGDLEVQ